MLSIAEPSACREAAEDGDGGTGESPIVSPGKINSTDQWALQAAGRQLPAHHQLGLIH